MGLTDSLFYLDDTSSSLMRSQPTSSEYEKDTLVMWRLGSIELICCLLFSARQVRLALALGSSLVICSGKLGPLTLHLYSTTATTSSSKGVPTYY